MPTLSGGAVGRINSDTMRARIGGAPESESRAARTSTAHLFRVPPNVALTVRSKRERSMLFQSHRASAGLRRVEYQRRAQAHQCRYR
jgi:hypothetical protein